MRFLGILCAIFSISNLAETKLEGATDIYDALMVEIEWVSSKVAIKNIEDGLVCQRQTYRHLPWYEVTECSLLVASPSSELLLSPSEDNDVYKAIYDALDVEEEAIIHGLFQKRSGSLMCEKYYNIQYSSSILDKVLDLFDFIGDTHTWVYGCWVSPTAVMN